MKKANEIERGFTDQPAPEDLFNVQSYIDCLSNFVETCKTPITVSIQGAWGSGKTSFMNLVRKTLNKDNVIDIWFNTWQFSQFDKNSNLAISLMTVLSRRLQDSKASSETSEKIKRFASTLKSMAIIASSVAIETAISGRAAESFNQAMQDNHSQGVSNLVESIETLKEDFQNLINERLAETGKNRVVIFVDDLDRLNPIRAVELLEVLKLFLDCKHCVFILAIDYDVVCRGVAQKYNFQESEMDKGRSFFDKIIQVPFKLPIASYNVQRYIKQCLEDINIKVNDSELNTYEALIRTSMGTNPRSMKRLFNAFLLLNIMTEFNKLNVDKHFLFAALCMQFLSDNLYNYFVANALELNAESIQKLLSGKYENCQSLFNMDDIDLSEREYENCSAFLYELSNVLCSNGQSITPDKLEQFKSALSLTATTSSSVIAQDSNKQRTFKIDRSYSFRLEDKVFSARAAFAFECLKRYAADHPDMNLAQLNAVFTDDRLPRIQLLSKEEGLARFKESTFNTHCSRFFDLTNGQRAYMYGDWTVKNTLRFAEFFKEQLGYDVEVISNNSI